MIKTARMKPEISLSGCSYRWVLDIISNKWTALVIYAMEDGSIRYGQMKRRIEGVSQKMLTQTLRQLERDGLVKRDIHQSVNQAVEYSLTPLGETLVTHLHQLRQWTKDNYPLVEKAREAYDIENVQE